MNRILGYCIAVSFFFVGCSSSKNTSDSVAREHQAAERETVEQKKTSMSAVGAERMDDAKKPAVIRYDR